MPKAKILIVEDEKDIVRMLEYNLRKEGFNTLSARDGETGFETARREMPDLILLDLMLPGMDGFEVCKALKNEKRTSSVPVIMLTAKSQESDKVIGLELGADDYITKPFSLRELTARVKAVLRRVSGKGGPPDVFVSGDLAVDFSGIKVTVKNKPADLTSKEFELLKELIRAKGRVLSRDHLLNNVWGLAESIEIETRTVDVHIRTLRKKLRSEARRIVTVKNYGYRFQEDSTD